MGGLLLYRDGPSVLLTGGKELGDIPNNDPLLPIIDNIDVGMVNNGYAFIDNTLISEHSIINGYRVRDVSGLPAPSVGFNSSGGDAFGTNTYIRFLVGGDC